MNVRVVSTSSAVDAGSLAAGVHRLEADGYRVSVADGTADRHGHLGGTDRQRADALLAAARDPEVDVVWAARGGYGAMRMLPMLADADVLPGKVLIGYSDVTPLLHVARGWGWRAVHGPVVTSNPSAAVRREVRDLLAGGAGDDWPVLTWWTKRAAVSGPLVGGNLTLLAATCGTPWQVETAGRLVLIEEVREPLYKIDRMLTQLRLAGVFDGAAGVVLGRFTKVGDEGNLGVATELRRMFGELGVPVAAGLPVGHVKHNRPIELHVPHALSRDGQFSRA